MRIDMFSLIIGMILWEVLKTYLHEKKVEHQARKEAKKRAKNKESE